MEQRHCIVCGKSFTPQTHNQKCCSAPPGKRRSRCSARLNNHRNRGTALTNDLPAPFDCAHCDMRCIPGENVAPHATKFCGKGCKAKWHRSERQPPLAVREARERERERERAERTQRQAEGQRRKRRRDKRREQERELKAYERALRRDPCAYCGEARSGCVDHIEPRGEGGADKWDNMTGACLRCNSTKGTVPLLEALLWVPVATEYHRQRQRLFSSG